MLTIEKGRAENHRLKKHKMCAFMAQWRIELTANQIWILFACLEGRLNFYVIIDYTTRSQSIILFFDIHTYITYIP
jgi:hypothetical protein